MTQVAARTHNNPPEPIDGLKEKLALYKEGAAKFGPVTDANAQEYRDHIGYGVKLAKEIDAQRDSEKRPHLEAGRKVDAAYKPLIEETEATQKRLKNTLQAFVVERERKAQEGAREAARLLRVAEEAKRAAEEAAQAEAEEDPFLAATAAPAPDTKAEEEAARLASLQASAASRVSSAAGGFAAAGLRDKRTGVVTDWPKTVQHYVSHPDLQQVVLKLVAADIRHAKGADITIPGVDIVTERVL